MFIILSSTWSVRWSIVDTGVSWLCCLKPLLGPVSSSLMLLRLSKPLPPSLPSLPPLLPSMMSQRKIANGNRSSIKPPLAIWRATTIKVHSEKHFEVSEPRSDPFLSLMLKLPRNRHHTEETLGSVSAGKTITHFCPDSTKPPSWSTQL